jgi:hypothetical protein
LAGPTAVEIRLDVSFGKFEARRATVHNHTHTPAVGFTPRRDAKEMAKGVRHAESVREGEAPVNARKSPMILGSEFPLVSAS